MIDKVALGIVLGIFVAVALGFLNVPIFFAALIGLAVAILVAVRRERS